MQNANLYQIEFVHTIFQCVCVTLCHVKSATTISRITNTNFSVSSCWCKSMRRVVLKKHWHLHKYWMNCYFVLFGCSAVPSKSVQSIIVISTFQWKGFSVRMRYADFRFGFLVIMFIFCNLLIFHIQATVNRSLSCKTQQNCHCESRGFTNSIQYRVCQIQYNWIHRGSTR